METVASARCEGKLTLALGSHSKARGIGGSSDMFQALCQSAFCKCDNYGIGVVIQIPFGGVSIAVQFNNSTIMH